jgi:hypothetical protein
MSATGEQLKAEGMSRAASGAPEQWKVEMLECIKLIAKDTRRFNSDPVFLLADRIGVVPHTENRAIGPVFCRAAKLGYIRKTQTMPQFVNSDRPALHKTPLQMWDSLIIDDEFEDLM